MTNATAAPTTAVGLPGRSADATAAPATAVGLPGRSADATALLRLVVAVGDGAPEPVVVDALAWGGPAGSEAEGGVPAEGQTAEGQTAAGQTAAGLPDGFAPGMPVAVVELLEPRSAGAEPVTVLVDEGATVLAGALRRAGAAVRRLDSSGPTASLARALRAGAGVPVERPTAAVAVTVPHGSARPADASAAWAAIPPAVRQVIEYWGRAAGGRRVVLAAPRSFCAGVERAVEIVERSIDRFGAPVYVRRQIVHNSHVVHDLEQRGAVFVQELHEVPEGATVVLAAHGVAPAVRDEAEQRDLTVVDATCPLVAKVHREARRFAGEGRRIVLVGHADHEEVEGTVGEAPDLVQVVAGVDEVARLPLSDDAPVAYLTQTTLAIDETAGVVEALRTRFTDIVGPTADDICYATQNRQDAVRSMSGECDLVLVVGSANSSNTARLVEVARRQGRRAELIEDETELELSWLAGVGSVGITAGASAPESVVRDVVDALGTLGPVSVSEHRTTEEHVRFSLPQQVR